MRTLKGKTIIVTGASAGVGEATARQCAAQGANVVLAARDKKALTALAKKLGKRARAVPTDVSRAGDCRALIQASADAFGRIDGLVNNAGYNCRGAVEEVPLNDLMRIVETEFDPTTDVPSVWFERAVARNGVAPADLQQVAAGPAVHGRAQVGGQPAGVGGAGDPVRVGGGSVTSGPT
jgi:NADP-dependent 3-hydroxy acid dehydrogenase YdfG